MKTLINAETKDLFAKTAGPLASSAINCIDLTYGEMLDMVRYDQMPKGERLLGFYVLANNDKGDPARLKVHHKSWMNQDGTDTIIFWYGDEDLGVNFNGAHIDWKLSYGNSPDLVLDFDIDEGQDPWVDDVMWDAVYDTQGYKSPGEEIRYAFIKAPLTKGICTYRSLRLGDYNGGFRGGLSDPRGYNTNAGRIHCNDVWSSNAESIGELFNLSLANVDSNHNSVAVPTEFYHFIIEALGAYIVDGDISSSEDSVTKI